MIRLFWLSALAALLLINVGCGTMCRRPLCGPSCGPTCPPGKGVFVPPPPPSTLVPAGGVTFGPPNASFPTAPSNATFGPPGTPFPTAPPSNGFKPAPPSNGFPTAPPSVTPSITPMQPKVESNFQPIENGDAKPRVQLYAPEAIDKEKPKVTEEPPAGKKPAATFPVIPQFAEVKTNVYAGLRPGAAGLDWLQSNRLGTVVCLHSPGEDPAADKKDTEARGIRFYAIEVSPQNLTKEGFDGFIKLVRESAEKGIFVYDRDGSIAGPMWYLYLRMGEFLDDEPAQLRARSLGLQNNREGLQRDMWVAVQKLLSENNR